MEKVTINRQTVDLSTFPHLIVIYLGMRVNFLTGIKTLLGFGPKISQSVTDKPDGLLLHENIIYSIWPLHMGMRQYWRDFDSLEAWARSEPHRVWWQTYLKNTRGTGFWHETYFLEGGMEAVYINMVKKLVFFPLPRQLKPRAVCFLLVNVPLTCVLIVAISYKI
jgi:hypothetical protein